MPLTSIYIVIAACVFSMCKENLSDFLLLILLNENLGGKKERVPFKEFLRQRYFALWDIDFIP